MALLPDPTQQLESGHARQFQIEDHQNWQRMERAVGVGAHAFQIAKGSVSAGQMFDGILYAGPLERTHEQLGVGRLVFHQQNCSMLLIACNHAPPTPNRPSKGTICELREQYAGSCSAACWKRCGCYRLDWPCLASQSRNSCSKGLSLSRMRCRSVWPVARWQSSSAMFFTWSPARSIAVAMASTCRLSCPRNAEVSSVCRTTRRLRMRSISSRNAGR